MTLPAGFFAQIIQPDGEPPSPVTDYNEAVRIAGVCQAMRDVSSSAEFIRAVMLANMGDAPGEVYMISAAEKVVEARKQIDALEAEADKVIRAHAVAQLKVPR